ncbi:MAG: hypothetical protein WC378_02085 [Opitutaceae bacterium]|jgi:hypothetical protein
MSTPEPGFERLTGTDLFWLSASGKTIGFQCSPGAVIGDTPALKDTWGDQGGIYLFLGSSPADEKAFAAALPGYLRKMGWPKGPRFLWLRNPGAPAGSWDGMTLDMTLSGGVWRVRQRCDFVFGSYIVAVTGGAVATLAGEAQGWGFAFSKDAEKTEPPPVAMFFAPGGSYDTGSGQLRLPLTGTTVGCWRFELSLTHGAESETDFDRLHAGIRFFYPEREAALANAESDTEDSGKTASTVRSLVLKTLLQPAKPAISLSVAADVLKPLDPERTHLAFFPEGGGTGPGTFDSTFATARGYGVKLTPQPASPTQPDARLVFAKQPLFTGSDGDVPYDYYLTPQGAFEITWSETDAAAAAANAAADEIQRLLCGTSGIEYLGIPADAQGCIVFVPGRAAYSDLVPITDPSVSPLNALGTTSWTYLSLLGTKKAKYYAQAENAPVYQAGVATAENATRTNLGSEFLSFLELPTVELPSSQGQTAFPMAPYRGLPADDVAAALVVEAAAIAPARRRELRAITRQAWENPAVGGLAKLAATPTAKTGVTQQGLGIGVAEDGMTWTWLGIASQGTSSGSKPNLCFTAVGGAFRQAIQTNRLFFVSTNADTFMKSASVSYQLTAGGIEDVRAEKKVPQEIVDAVALYFQTAKYPVYQTEDEFTAALHSASPGADPYAVDFERVAGLLTPTIEDWCFQMSPRNWSNPDRVSRKNAIVVWKFCRGRTLRSLASDVSSWSWPEAGIQPGGTAADTSKELIEIFKDSEESYLRTSGGGRQSPYADFIRLLDDPDWSGIIAFSVDVPLRTLPEPLQVLAVGIDKNRFYAHHVGFNITPFGADQGTLVFGKTSMFGLIDYQDTVDQFFSKDVYYAFKVLRLTVGFRNSAMASFSSQVELLINRLFGGVVCINPTDHGNNVILDGVYQSHPSADGQTHGTYVFSMVNQNNLQIADTALRLVVLRSTQLATAKPANADDPKAKVVGTFQLGGDLHFFENKEADLFSFGSAVEDAVQVGKDSAALALAGAGDETEPSQSRLRFANLGIAMVFSLSERIPSFSLVTETLSFDSANSIARPNSLFARFPLKIAGLLATPDPGKPGATPEAAKESAQMPESMGFAAIDAPIQQARLADPWYGLLFDIDLGTLGSLAGSLGITLRLLLGWSGGGTRNEPAVCVAVKLPGMKETLGVELPLQGVISLGFRTIQLVSITQGGQRQYLLRFRDFALRFLGLSFPPGYNNIVLFANPDQSSNTKLGWYAAYSAEKDKKKEKKTSRNSLRLAARQRTAPMLSKPVSRKEAAP